MRKLVFIAAMVLASATAEAGQSRGLTLASNDHPAAIEQPKMTEQKPAGQKLVEAPVEAPKAVETPATTEAPKFVARPAPVETTSQPQKIETTKTETTQSVAEKSIQTTQVEKPKRRRESTEARVIRELHRHGIYW
jgi:hypothetical protein